jgi:diaminopimelate epimerase
MIPFTKMQGLGNDFVVIDATKNSFHLPVKTIQQMGDRHFGIGFDQLLIIEKSSKPGIDFNYRIFNADGKEAEQCGNGARAIARYIHVRGLSKKHEMTVSTLAGDLQLRIEKDGQVSVNMGEPILEPRLIPFEADKQALSYKIKLQSSEIEIGAVSMGNPHAVIQVANVKSAPVQEWGSKIECHPRFPKHTNVGFMEIISPQKINLRVFERGVGETLACGTGACAAMVIGRIRNQLDKQVSVNLPGGQLLIQWPGPGSSLWMTGPAEEIFTGEWP